MKIKKAVLVYQGGIANVFAVSAFNLMPDKRDAKLLLQANFRACEFFARGLGAAGVIVRTMACNQANDVKNAIWSNDLQAQIFNDRFHVVEIN